MTATNQLTESSLKIILETAVEFLAGKHNVTTNEIIQAMRNGNAKIWSQINTLLETGVEAAKVA